jgi:hypothetical protein
VATKKASPTKKSTAKKSTTKKSSTQSGDGTAEKRDSRRSSSAPRAASQPGRSGAEISDTAAAEIRDLTGREVESVTSLQHGDDGWNVQVEVLEVARIPDTTDLLALYEVQLDDAGHLQGFHRVRRYTRGTPDSG